MLHADAQSAIATHGVPGKAATGRFRNGAIVCVDIGDELGRDKFFPVACGNGTGIHTALITSEGVRRNENNFAVTGGLQCFVDDGREIDPMFGRAVPLVVAVGEPVEKINNGIAAMFIGGVARREIDGDVAIGGIALEISFERGSVNFYVLDRARGRGCDGRNAWQQRCEEKAYEEAIHNLVALREDFATGESHLCNMLHEPSVCCSNALTILARDRGES